MKMKSTRKKRNFHMENKSMEIIKVLKIIVLSMMIINTAMINTINTMITPAVKNMTPINLAKLQG
jgi:hypothetical protein